MTTRRIAYGIAAGVVAIGLAIGLGGALGPRRAGRCRMRESTLRPP